ncbi:MAG: hypothetical protein WAL88_05685, partial [Nitrosotalea sp.]
MRSAGLASILALFLSFLLPPVPMQAVQNLDATNEVHPVPADQQDVLVLGPLHPLMFRLHLLVDKVPFRDYYRDQIKEILTEADADHDGHL